MTFNPITPNAGESPSLFPTQNNACYSRLQTTIGAEHVFNPSADPTDGIHKQVTLITAADPGSLPAGNGIVYLKSIGPANRPAYYDGSKVWMIPVCRSYVTFNGSSAVLGTAFNATVTGPNPDLAYDISFPDLLPSTNVQVCVSCNGGVSGVATNILVLDTDLIRVRFFQISGNILFTAFTQASVMIFGG